MQLFYNPSLTEATEYFTFDREESKHIVKVLRKKEGDILHVTNGLGLAYCGNSNWYGHKMSGQNHID